MSLVLSVRSLELATAQNKTLIFALQAHCVYNCPQLLLSPTTINQMLIAAQSVWSKYVAKLMLLYSMSQYCEIPRYNGSERVDINQKP